jgi:hypothetical protein
MHTDRKAGAEEEEWKIKITFTNVTIKEMYLQNPWK